MCYLIKCSLLVDVVVGFNHSWLQSTSVETSTTPTFPSFQSQIQWSGGWCLHRCAWKTNLNFTKKKNFFLELRWINVLFVCIISVIRSYYTLLSTNHQQNMLTSEIHFQVPIFLRKWLKVRIVVSMAALSRTIMEWRQRNEGMITWPIIRCDRSTWPGPKWRSPMTSTLPLSSIQSYLIYVGHTSLN